MSAHSDGSWWSDLQPYTVVRGCHSAAAKKDKERGDLIATERGLQYVGSVAAPLTIPWPSINAIAVKTGVEKKVSGARVAAMGPLAFAAKKKVETLSVVVSSGVEAFTFDCPDHDVQTVKDAVRPISDALARRPQRSPAPTGDVPSPRHEVETQPPPTAPAASVPTTASLPSPGAQWWSGIPEGTLNSVLYHGAQKNVKAILRITAEGIEWGEKNTASTSLGRRCRTSR